MIKEAIAHVFALGKKAAAFQEYITPQGSRIVATPDGEVKTFDAPPLRVHDRLSTFGSLTRWLADLQDEDSAIFVSGDEVRAIVGRETRPAIDTKTAFVNMEYTPAFSALVDLCTKPWQQRDLIKLLRGPLAKACPPGVVGLFRVVEFRSSGASSSAITNSGDSLGRSLNREAKVGPDGSLPETIVFSCPVFDVPECEPTTVEMAVEVDFASNRFEFVPIGDALGAAELRALQGLALELSAEFKGPIYLGSASQV